MSQQATPAPNHSLTVFSLEQRVETLEREVKEHAARLRAAAIVIGELALSALPLSSRQWTAINDVLCPLRKDCDDE